MLRVAKKVRIFPLADLNAEKSPFVTGIFEEFISVGFSVDIRKVSYEFQRGVNEYMEIKRM